MGSFASALLCIVPDENDDMDAGPPMHGPQLGFCSFHGGRGLRAACWRELHYM